MYRVTGANLFGQWLQDDSSIVSEFQLLSKSKNAEYNVDLNRAKLSDINWAYNIFQLGSEFYVTGFWDGKENNIAKVTLPEDCSIVDVEANLEIIGDDYNLFLIDKKSKLLWVIDVENGGHQKLNLNLEAPLENSLKRPRRESQISKIVLTHDYIVTLTSDGRLYEMPYGAGVQPTPLETSHCVGTVCDIQSGYEHFLLLTSAGRVYTWGNGRRLQLGHGDLDNLDIPKLVDALAGIHITKIRAGGWHCLALSEFGDLYTWGWNDTGQLGVRHPDTKGVLNRGGLKSYPLPTLVDISDENDEEIHTNIDDIACGSRHSAIVLADNTVWTTGYNKYGQLGFSQEDHQELNYYTKAYNCENNTEIRCGQWCTVLVNKH